MHAHKDEKIEQMLEDIEHGYRQLNEAQGVIATSDSRLSTASQRIKDLEESVRSCQTEYESTSNNLQVLQVQYNTLTDEHR